MSASRCKQVAWGVGACLLTLIAAFPAEVGAAFSYGPIADPILGASFSGDFAALTAHRFVLGFEVNVVRLLGSDGSVLDLSDVLFGTADAVSDPALIDQGALGTGIITAGIAASFFAALATGNVDLSATLTDTDDGVFAIDFLSLRIETAGGTVGAFIDSNNGFGTGVPDGGALPSPLPTSIPIGATGTGFDEAIGSLSLQPKLGGPSALALMSTSALSLVGYSWLRRARWSCRRRRRAGK